jgi:pyrroline-5-carboxylate reductase
MVQRSGLKTATVFLGGGRITSALCSGLRLGRYESDLVVYDRNPSKLRALRRESGVEIARDLKSAIERAHVLILAVRPASVLGLLDEIERSGIAPGLCVSLAAGVPLSTLRRSAGAVRFVRAMPSPVCRIGRGLTAITFDRAVTRTQRRQVREFFSIVGHVIEIPERQFDAFTATYSSSHGYHALATLASQAQRAGLDRKTALTAAAHALADGIAYWRESGLGLEELLHEAATPGGIAAATMQAMDRTGYAMVVAEGIQAGIQQAERNAKDSAQRSTGKRVL